MANRSGYASLSNPFLTLGLILVVLSLFLVITRLSASPQPPTIPGYHWNDHSRVLVVAYFCGACGLSPTAQVAYGLSHRLDTLVVSSRPDEYSEELRKLGSPPHVTVITNASLHLLKELCPNNGQTVLLVDHGHLVRRATGADAAERVIE